jgi:class 3 adenylate cyclase/tetratricopeptide (TPR) repeat protein
MKCPKCQFDNRQGAKFCLQCGGNLQFLCPQCGRTLPFLAKFCDECGHDLGKPKEAPSIDYSQPQAYTPRFLVDKILTTRGFIEGERKPVTVLFADVVNYTSISEKLDPEEVHQIMDGCFQILMNEVHRYEGTIDKFTGDGLMALFGAPMSHEDHAQRACYAALAMQRAIEEYGAKIEKEFSVDFKMRVGLNSGPVIVGSIGNDLRMEYTAVGDTVNLASRMESAAESGTIQVTEETHRLTGEYFGFKPLGDVEVKGKKETVRAYQLLGVGPAKDRLRATMARGLTRFVGRTRELEHLADCFAQVKEGRGQVMGILGEAGVGKSRILLESRGILRREEYTYLEGSCLHYGDATAYLPILSVLRSYFDIREGEQQFLIKRKIVEKIIQLDEKLKGILPPLHDVLSLEVEDEGYLRLEPQRKREKTFEAIRNLLVRESQDRLLILAVEDLHWVDKTSEEFLSYLIGGLPNTHILLLLVYRPEYTHPWGSKSYYSQIRVDQLSNSASAELVQSILEGGEVAPDLKELIPNRTAGNPLFIEELTHALLENGSIQKKDHQYVLSREVSGIRVPDTIEGIIAGRMDRLEANLKRTMRVASVIGRDFAFRILSTITGMQEELRCHLIDLQTLEFIHEKSLFPELEYTFKHALTREVAYNSLLLKKRKDIHEKIGKAIEELYPGRLEEFYEMLAYHYSRSRNSEKAYHYLKLAGNKAARSYSNWEAFHFYKEAINLLNKLPETVQNKRKGIELRLLMEGPLVSLGHPEDSIEILRGGERLATELGDENSIAAFYNIIRGYYLVRGQPLQGLKYAENSFEAAMKMQNIDLAVSVGFVLCASYGAMGEHLKIAEVAPKVIALLEKTQRESEFCVSPWNVYSALLALYGFATGWTKDFEEGKALCEEGLDFALRIDDLYSRGWAEVMYSLLLVGHGDAKNAAKHAQNGVRLCEELQMLIILGTGLAALADAYRLLGELGTARKHAERALGVGSDSGLSVAWAQAYYSLTMIYLDSGDLENARSCAAEALKLSQDNNERWVEGESRAALGRILAKADPSQSDKAEKHTLQGIKILDELRLKPLSAQAYLYLGELYADTGHDKKALETLKKAEGMFQEMGMDYWLAKTQSVLERLQSCSSGGQAGSRRARTTKKHV